MLSVYFFHSQWGLRFYFASIFDCWSEQQWESCMSSMFSSSLFPLVSFLQHFPHPAAWGWERGGGEAAANVLLMFFRLMCLQGTNILPMCLQGTNILSSHSKEGAGQTRTAHPALEHMSMDHRAIGRFGSLSYILHVWFLVELINQTSQLLESPTLLENSPTWLIEIFEWERAASACSKKAQLSVRLPLKWWGWKSTDSKPGHS